MSSRAASSCRCVSAAGEESADNQSLYGLSADTLAQPRCVETQIWKEVPQSRIHPEFVLGFPTLEIPVTLKQQTKCTQA